MKRRKKPLKRLNNTNQNFKKMATKKNDLILTVVGAVGGAVLARIAAKHIPVKDEKIKAIIPVAAGFLAVTMKKTPPILKGVGFGMIGAGVPALAEALSPGIMGNSLSAPDDDSDLEIFSARRLEAPADQSILSAPADMSILSGVYDYSQEEDEISEPENMDEF